MKKCLPYVWLKFYRSRWRESRALDTCRSFVAPERRAHSAEGLAIWLEGFTTIRLSLPPPPPPSPPPNTHFSHLCLIPLLSSTCIPLSADSADRERARQRGAGWLCGPATLRVSGQTLSLSAFVQIIKGDRERERERAVGGVSKILGDLWGTPL